MVALAPHYGTYHYIEHTTRYLPPYLLIDSDLIDHDLYYLDQP
jgi:hypothetical protein